MIANTPTTIEHPIPARSLIVSCQAPQGSPFRRPEMIAAMASAAELGGASAVRVDGPDDVAAVAAAVSLPILGLHKAGDRDGVYITPTSEAAGAVIDAGASIVAVDGTDRPRPGGQTLAELVSRVHDRDVAVMADCATLEHGLFATDADCDLLGTTLSGYAGGRSTDGPDVGLVKELADQTGLPVIAEGRYACPDEVADAFDAGAYAVVVGTAITDPIQITRRFVDATPRAPHATAAPRTDPHH